MNRLVRLWHSRPRREWGFALAAFLAIGIQVGVLLVWMALDDRGPESGPSVAGLIALFFVPPLLVGGLSMGLFGARRRIGNACGIAGATFAVAVVAFMATGISDGLMHGPRYVIRGTARGTVAELAGTNAAWIELSPALVDVTRIGTGVYTSMDKNGHSSTKSQSVAPVVTALGERDPSVTAAEVVRFFVCDDKEDIREAGAGNGMISGRVSPAKDLAGDAIRDLGTRVRVGPEPRCITPTVGGPGATAWLWAIVALLYVIAFAFVASWLALEIARPRGKR